MKKHVLPIVAAALAALQSCENAPTREQPAAIRIDSAAVAATVQNETWNPQVPLREFACIAADFPLYLEGHLGNAPIAFTDTTDTLLMTNLLHALPSKSDEHLRGITLHYGLDTTRGQARLLLAIEFIHLLRTNDETDMVSKPYSPPRFHVMDGSALKSPDKTTWLKVHGGAYSNAARIRRMAGSAPVRLNDNDPRSYTYKWEEGLEKLIKDNGDAPGVHALRFVHAAEPQIRNGQHESLWYHIVAVHALALGNKPLIDDHDYGQGSYKMKGADLGSPCPPNCVPKRFPHNGNQPRMGCR